MEIKSLGSLREYNEERFTKRIVFQKDDSVVFVLNFKPGQSLPTHRHPGTAVYLLVLEGTGEVTVNGNAAAVAKDDAVWVDGDGQFSFSSTGSEPTSLYVMLAKIPDEKYAKDI